MTGAASCGENKYFYLVSLLEIGLIKYDFSSASQWLLGEKNIFPGGIQDRSVFFTTGGAGTWLLNNPQVVEYSEIPKDVSERREDNGKLAFRAANICNHFFTTEFLQRVCRELIQ